LQGLMQLDVDEDGDLSCSPDPAADKLP
jgi:hypothetical protein